MKHYYRMHIAVSPLAAIEVPEALAVTAAQWARPESVARIAVGSELLLQMVAEGYLCCGETEGEFAKRISTAVWKALGRYVKVSVDAIPVEELPNDSFEFGEGDYLRMLKAL